MKNVKDSLVECDTTAGGRIEGNLVRLGRFDAVFEVSECFDSLRTSEVLAAFKIVEDKRLLYEGRATVRKLVETPAGLLCEVALEDRGVSLEMLPGADADSFETFTRRWLSLYRIAPEFKVVVADMSILLGNVRSWMHQMEIAIQAGDPRQVAEREGEFLHHAAGRIIATVGAIHERFEELAGRIPLELRGAHQDYVWREWHSFFLSTPFGHRTYYKPLGYAGDFGMMDMIHRNAPEGGSLFNRAMHLLLVRQWPSESVRNRVAHLQGVLIDEVARVVRTGRRARILNLGCGPAREVQEFMRSSALSDDADFTLLDFNHETVTYTGTLLNDVKRRTGRRTGIEMRQMSVHQVLRAALAKDRASASTASYDVVYCAGLFDYLADSTCKALVKLFHRWLTPGGLVVVANMNDSKPFRNFIELILDWHLIYRDARAMWTFCPEGTRAHAVVLAEPTTVNLFLQIRRPE